MHVVTASEMRELDRRTIEELGIPGAVLMENAGTGAARLLLKRFRDLAGGSVGVICGAGNNGGDGFVLARRLAEEGVKVRVYLVVPAERIKGDARIYFEVVQRLGIPVQPLSEPGIGQRILDEWKSASCLVDAIFGTGLSREPEGPFREAIAAVQSAGRPVLALDIPSGIHADSGQVLGVAVHAEWTATFGLPKRGLYLFPGARYAGEVECVDIGIPQLLVQQFGLKEEVFEPDHLLGFLQRESDTHKGTYGRLFVLSGSTGKTGAACLCSEAALRCGAGLVTVGIPAPLNPILEQKLTEVMTLPLPSTSEGVLSREGLDQILEFASSADSLVVGPGLGLTEDIAEICREIWRHVEIPMVWDADALTLLATSPDLCRKQRAAVVITPHPGEMGRLVSRSAVWVQGNRVEAVKSFAENWNVVTLLKGARTLVADPSGRLRINPSGNPGMASGGMGDVLSGMIGGLVLQGINVFDAAALGAWLHGTAGDRVAAERGPLGFTASEVMAAVPEVYKVLVGK